MTSTMAARRSRSGPAPAPRPANDQTTFLSRWLKVWVILLTVVTLVVVVYLVIITNSLANINGNLATADRAVSGAGQDVTSLPNQVDRINGALDGIDKALKPIPAQAGEIVTVLTSVNDKLTSVDASLKDTSAVLSTVLGTVNNVSSTLVDANDPADRLGVQNIHMRVAAINGRNSPSRVAGGGGPGPFATGANLSAAETDARAIVGSLDSINTHLTGVCNSSLVVGTVLGCTA
jgi:cell division protein FtsL